MNNDVGTEAQSSQVNNQPVSSVLPSENKGWQALSSMMLNIDTSPQTMSSMLPREERGRQTVSSVSQSQSMIHIMIYLSHCLVGETKFTPLGNVFS